MNKNFLFKKGHKINLGRKNPHTEEWNKKIGLANSMKLKGKKLPLEVRKKISEALAGHKVSYDSRKKISVAHLGKKGKSPSEETRKKLSEANKGSRSYLWKGGITPINLKIRASLEYKLWREAVFKRDNYTCVWCKTRGGKLNADHIKPFALFPELRFAIDNGRTLCVECHKTTETYGGRTMVEYMMAVEREAGQLGISLPHPDDKDLAILK